MKNDLRLLHKADRRVRLGHAWIFSNEVDIAKTPLTAFSPGDVAVVKDAYGKPVGTAYVNPGALICARMLTSDAKAVIDGNWWFGRVRRALDLRERLYSSPHYRAVYAESDGCPGLIVDRYGDVLVAQLNTAGVAKMRDDVIGALERACKPRGILLRSAATVRQFEGIDEFDEPVGDVPDVADVCEDNAVFSAPLRKGQKTGYFFDQRDNRSRLARYVRDARVLDVYSYIGSWAVRAMKYGAQSATCVDSSELALTHAAENARRNAVEIETQRGDAIETMETFAAAGRRFDVVIVDPPSLIKRRKDIQAGQAMYERLNRAALRVLEPGGILVSCSCSHHLSPEMLQRTILQAAKDCGRRMQILERHAHAPDHPIHPAMPETEYLKAFFVRA
ncbi:MAG TPA: class I SAM-dependent rRNA methyltransferase [Candidatus Baltobacteraceae bacterium]|jgi:23S rRNA (cytosine1962-C5)-methyltransferase|nr:class I SAM-dependent rRNA methyltransferase [Candidatus Baltobacteraceae bacterium]